MKTRNARSIDSIVHRLETLEARTVLSADVGANAAAAPAPSGHQVLVADESFLSAGSDESATTTSPDDSEMYDFGGAWGTQAQPAAASTTAHTTYLDDGAVDQMGGFTGWTRTPADVLPLVTPQWADPADYTPMPAEFGPQADAPATPSIAASAPAPVVNAPETPAPDTTPADLTPVVIATGGASAADTTFVWIESSDSWLLTTKSKAAETVVIQNSFVS